MDTGAADGAAAAADGAAAAADGPANATTEPIAPAFAATIISFSAAKRASAGVVPADLARIYARINAALIFLVASLAPYNSLALYISASRSATLKELGAMADCAYGTVAEAWAVEFGTTFLVLRVPNVLGSYRTGLRRTRVDCLIFCFLRSFSRTFRK